MCKHKELIVSILKGKIKIEKLVQMRLNNENMNEKLEKLRIENGRQPAKVTNDIKCQRCQQTPLNVIRINSKCSFLHCITCGNNTLHMISNQSTI